jgi:hypothetical protein
LAFELQIDRQRLRDAATVSGRKLAGPFAGNTGLRERNTRQHSQEQESKFDPHRMSPYNSPQFSDCQISGEDITRRLDRHRTTGVSQSDRRRVYTARRWKCTETKPPLPK